MKETQRIKRIIITLIKGSPIVIGFLLVGLFIARKSIQYSTPMYQSMAKIKLDDRKYGMSGNNLYEDLDVFTSENRIETEAEILQSPLLIEKALEKFGNEVQIWREGKMKNTFLYADNPFKINYSSDFGYRDEELKLKVIGSSTYQLLSEEGNLIVNGEFGKKMETTCGSISVHLNDSLVSRKQINVQDNYLVKIYSVNQLIGRIQKNLDVKAVDKEIAVLRVVFTWEDPDFASDFANALCQSYIEDYIETKSMAAHKTLNFIDDRMIDINASLTSSENNLESYKMDNDVVNTLQETETGLREISKLQVQLINLQLEEDATFQLKEYIQNGDYYEETAITFGFGDLTLTELVKKLKLYTDEKKDLLLKYTEEDQQVINVQAKIDDVEAYIKEAVGRNLEAIALKREKLETELNQMKLQFEDFPTREKELRILEREFLNNESVYNFLFQKKLEAQIATNALISFHRIIQPATPADKPISPNSVLITFVCGFLSLVLGVIVIFTFKKITGKIINVADIERLTSIPVIGALKKHKTPKRTEFISLAQSLFSHDTNGIPNLILTTSSIRHEGKTYITQHLAEVINQMGYKTAILSFNPFQAGALDHDIVFYVLDDTKSFPEVDFSTVQRIGCSVDHEEAGIILGHVNFQKTLNKIKEVFDVILIDSPGAVISPLASTLAPLADTVLYILRSKKSKGQYISNADIMQSKVKHVPFKLILNGVHDSTNFSGLYTGAMLSYKKVPKNVFKRLIYRLKAYSA